jgi:hypothetical protein
MSTTPAAVVTPTLDELLSSRPGHKDSDETPTLELVAMARQGAAPGTLEVALDDTGQWIALPKKLVLQAEDAGQITLAGQTHTVLSLRLQRPAAHSAEAAWFDLLAFALRRGNLLYRMARPAGCGCHSNAGDDTTGLPPGAHAAQRKKPTTTAANCFACWIMTLSSAPGFCYTYGHCDN